MDPDSDNPYDFFENNFVEIFKIFQKKNYYDE